MTRLSPRGVGFGRSWRGFAGALLVVCALLVGAPLGARTLESVGAVGVREGDRTDPKERAVEAAVREAVWRVAEELLVDAILVQEEPTSLEMPDAPAGVEEEEPDLDAILGDDMVVYTARFKVIEDRGLGPALFSEAPDVVSEYVVVAEVVVETERIRERLTLSGLLEPEAAVAGLGTVELEIEGLLVYPALMELRELLVGGVGVERATPRVLERGRTVLAVETPLRGPELVAALERLAPLHLTLVALRASDDSARIAVRWNPPASAVPANGAPGEGDPAELPTWATP